LTRAMIMVFLSAVASGASVERVNVASAPSIQQLHMLEWWVNQRANAG